MRILFSSDLHGNDGQYARLFNAAADEGVDAVIIGGDIAPKRLADDEYIKGQQNWYGNLDVMLQLYRKAHPAGQVFMMMGNDDAVHNFPLFLYVLRRNGARQLHNRRYAVGGIDIVGYSCVPITPFGIKDWERHESLRPSARARALQTLRLSDVSYQGWVSHNGSRHPVDTRQWRSSIEEDLARPMFLKRPSETVYAMHAPPVGTALDRLPEGHVGSIAICEFIERHRPLITLHGHIHPTVEVSGAFMERIGNTVSYSCGNDDRTFGNAAILIDTRKPGDGKRVIL